MNLKIYEKREAEKKVFYLGLIPVGESIVLAVVNKDGSPALGGRMLTISSDGVFHRATGLDDVDGWGLSLDDKGRVKMGVDY